jgi:BirA family transcriptional regulator, biotin operon repressor / biotin---[acetyl-CoA-carboxylase] ligase
MFEPLPDDIMTVLAASAARLGSYADVRFRSEIGSTNDAALALAVAGATEGTSVLADVQHRGRGRRGRDWFSPAGAGLYLSVIVRPTVTAEVAPVLTLGAGVAVARAIRGVAGLPVDLKWPNDIVIGRPWRKLGGVLSEAASAGATIDAVVVGIGINLRPAAYPPAVATRATSLETELGRPIERAPLVAALLVELRAMTERLHTGGRDAICGEWRVFGRAGLAGAAVSWDDHTGARRGRAVDIASDGALVVDVAGRLERVIAGEVLWES